MALDTSTWQKSNNNDLHSAVKIIILIDQHSVITMTYPESG